MVRFVRNYGTGGGSSPDGADGRPRGLTSASQCRDGLAFCGMLFLSISGVFNDLPQCSSGNGAVFQPGSPGFFRDDSEIRDGLDFDSEAGLRGCLPEYGVCLGGSGTYRIVAVPEPAESSEKGVKNGNEKGHGVGAFGVEKGTV